jgi:integrase
MKAGREHRVPLSAHALAILEEMQAHRHADDGFVFPGGKTGKPLSNMAFLMLLRRMNRGDLTAHGFRATFKTWASERTGSQNEIVEAALAHVVGSKVEQAYQRGDMFEKRRRLMQQWATFCTTPAQERPHRASHPSNQHDKSHGLRHVRRNAVRQSSILCIVPPA